MGISRCWADGEIICKRRGGSSFFSLPSLFSWFPSSLAYNFLRSIPTHFNISKSPATTYQIRPLSLLARKTILTLLRCEGSVVLMSWRRINLKEERRQSSLLFSSLPFLQSRAAVHLTPVASPASFAGWERKKGLLCSLSNIVKYGGQTSKTAILDSPLRISGCGGVEFRFALLCGESAVYEFILLVFVLCLREKWCTAKNCDRVWSLCIKCQWCHRMCWLVVYPCCRVWMGGVCHSLLAK